MRDTNSAKWLLQMKDELAPYEVTPAKQYLTYQKKKLYPRKCAEKSIEYFKRHLSLPDVRIIGGLYHGRSGHVWIEIDDRLVFDGTLQRFYRLKDYYRIQKAEKLVSYTTAEYQNQAINHERISLNMLTMITFAGQVIDKADLMTLVKTGKLPTAGR